MTDIQLNDQQVEAIMVEAVNRELIDAMPDNIDSKRACTEELINIAKNAFNNGNRSDNVQTVLFMAQVDQKPLVAETVEDKFIEDNISIPDLEDHIHNGIDLTSLSDGVIEGLIVGLDKYPQSEQVEEDRKAYLAEKERRNEKGSQIQDDSQGTTPQAAPEKAGEAAPEGAHSQPVVDDQVSPESGVDGGSGEVPELSSAQGENAGAFASAQTPETSPEGKQAKAKPVEENGNRSALEDQLTLPIVKAHGVDISKLSSIPIAQIEFMLEYPAGPPQEKKEVIDENEIEETAVTNKEAGNTVGGIVVEDKAPEMVASKADLGLEVEEGPASNNDRENIEAQVTGPTLRAYARGRKEIPNIGINELKFMVDHPDGKVDPSELEAAKRLDNGETVVKSSGLPVPPPLSADESMDNQGDAEQIVAVNSLTAPIKLSVEEDRTLTTAAFEAVAKSPPIEEVNSKINLNKWSDVRPKDIPNEAGRDRAMEIISRERMPIAPELDGDPPVLPLDVSKCSRDELFSLHAKFHACESRMNWIVSEFEDQLGDITKLRTHREAVVAAAVPFMGEDGKRNTNEYRDAQVAADQEVLDLGMKEHELNKSLKKLKVLQRNYSKDCERLSRQMSKYETERADAPR